MLLSDNGWNSTNQIAYVNELDFDHATLGQSWVFGGALNISQRASSIAWGTRFGQPIALLVSTSTNLLSYQPFLASNRVLAETATNTGNFNKVVFNPTDPANAWIFSSSGSGFVTLWDGSYQSSYSIRHGFSGWSVIDFDIDQYGDWKAFSGRNGRVWMGEGGWAGGPYAGTFTDQTVPNWTAAPFYGTSNDYLLGVAFRPDSCQFLMVGDATAGQGMIVLAQMQ